MAHHPVRIAVAGATGTLGAPLVARLREGGHEVVAISRSSGVDVISGEGLDEALGGAQIVIDAAGDPTADQEGATQFFTTAAQNLLASGRRAGVHRFVVISVVGCDRFRGGGPYGGYYAAKAAHEQAYRKTGAQVQIVRAAQFHELIPMLLDWGTEDNVGAVPHMSMQPVSAGSLAAAVAALVNTLEAGHGPEIAEITGPQPEDLLDMAQRYAARRGSPARVEEADYGADPDREIFLDGGLLPSPDAVNVGPTFAEWLERSVAP
jgi:uncharacterized protein YbjT (DUF2867 family)